MEYFPAGDLQTYIRKHGRLLEDNCRQIASQLLRGLAAMHHESFAHRDVKPQVRRPQKILVAYNARKHLISDQRMS
jgi:serine/threonine protein kinase